MLNVLIYNRKSTIIKKWSRKLNDSLYYISTLQRAHSEAFTHCLFSYLVYLQNIIWPILSSCKFWEATQDLKKTQIQKYGPLITKLNTNENFFWVTTSYWATIMKVTMVQNPRYSTILLHMVINLYQKRSSINPRWHSPLLMN